MRRLPSGIMGNGILALTLTKICVGRCGLTHLKYPPATEERGNVFVCVHRCGWIGVCEESNNELVSVDLEHSSESFF